MATKTIGQHAASAAVSTARTASKTVQAIAPIEGAASYGGYWNFVAGSIILMFLLYVAQKGHLSTWIGFFSWTAPASIGTATNTPAQSAGTAPSAANPNVLTVVGAWILPGFPGLNISNPAAGIPVVGGAVQSLLPGNSNSTTPSTPPATPGTATINPFAQWLSPYLKSLGINNQ
jgi:hypothetical protein